MALSLSQKQFSVAYILTLVSLMLLTPIALSLIRNINYNILLASSSAILLITAFAGISLYSTQLEEKSFLILTFAVCSYLINICESVASSSLTNIKATHPQDAVKLTRGIVAAAGIIVPTLMGYAMLTSNAIPLIVSSGCLLLSIILLHKTRLYSHHGNPYSDKAKLAFTKRLTMSATVKWHIRMERYYLVIAIINQILITLVSLVVVPMIIKENFSGSEFSFGLAQSGTALGLALMSFYALGKLSKILSHYTLASAGLAGASIGILSLIFFQDNIVGIMIGLTLYGASVGAYGIIGSSKRIQAYPDNLRLSLSALDQSLSKLGIVLAFIVVYFYSDQLSISMLTLCISIIYLFCATALLYVPNWKQFTEMDDKELKGYYEKIAP